MDSPFALLSLIIAMPFLGMLFVLTIRDDDETAGRNAFNVCVFTLIANMIIIWRIFMVLDEDNHNLQLLESFRWLNNPGIDIVLGVDPFSLLLILGAHIAVLIGLSGIRGNVFRQKSLMIFTLLFLSMATGFFVAADIFSFYIFFEAMLLPLFMIIGIFGEVRKQGLISRFFLYNFIGAIVLFSATMIIYHYYGSVTLEKVSSLPLAGGAGFYVWGAICLSFLFRIPIWPFHSWVSAVSSGIKNPLVFIVANLMPLSGIYSFIRFWPQSMPDSIIFIVTALEIISVISMLFIALIGLINKDIQYKIFSFMTVYYIFFLLGGFLPTDQILLNVGFSLFAFMLIFASLEVLVSFQEEERLKKNISVEGILFHMPRASALFTFMVFAGLGLPISAMFINNFVIVSGLLIYNFSTAVVALVALVLVASALLQELFVRRQKVLVDAELVIVDVSKLDAVFMWGIAAILLMSLSDPLWFMRG